MDFPRINASNIDWNKVKVFTVIGVIVALGFFLRTFYAWTPAIQNGFAVSGGADSYYHERVIDYILNTKHQLLYDTMLNYPVGLIDPRPPFFEWAVVGMSYLYLPFVGWNMYTASDYSLMLITAIFGALIAVPMYLIGRDVFNKKVGIIAAFLVATSASNMMRSVASWGGYDDMILFFALFTWYFFLKALKSVKKDVWIENWFSYSGLKSGFKKFATENKVALLYGALSGTSLATIALMWTGFSYVETIILIYLIIQVFINRFRNVSSFHILMISIVFGIFAFALSLPWYVVENATGVWYNVPLYLLLFAIFVTLYLELTLKLPWPMTFVIAGVSIVAIYVLAWLFVPQLMEFIVTGQGYFVKNKLYSTIAEAQAPSLAEIISNVGAGTFFMFVAGLFYMLYLLRKNLNDYYLFIIIFSVVSVYMAFSAARFIFNASPGFMIPAAFMLGVIIDKLNLPQIYKDFKNLSHMGFGGVRKSVKLSHIVVVLLITVLIMVPNIWGAMDAAIPFGNKTQYDKQIYNAMPSYFQPVNYSGMWYLGAYGYQLPSPQDPWHRAWAWLATQDTNLSPQDRPAFMSWWDYGFEGIQLGQHPVVADNFQDGYQVAGQVLTTQNESKVIALLIARVLDGDNKIAGSSVFTPNVKATLIQYLGAVEEQKIEQYYNYNTNQQFKPTILSNPSIYGIYDSNISSPNIKYIMIKGDLSSQYKQNTLVNLYSVLEKETGFYISYMAVDYRLFPFSGTQTGIFYAPATLADREIQNVQGNLIPYNYYTLVAVDSNGNTYPINNVPANVQIVNYQITYQPMFYNTTLYRIFVGYSGQDIGAPGGGIPGLSTNMQYYYPMQAWNMTHFELVYKTAFWNPYKDYKNHTSAWKPIPIQLAYLYQKENNGTVDMNPPASQILPNDVVMVKYYPGAIVQGRLTLPNGQPLSNVMVTLTDQYGIPHTEVYTNSQGYYKLYAVAGNNTLTFSTDGSMNKLMLMEKTTLSTVSLNVSQAQAERIPTYINPNGTPSYYISKNVVVQPSSVDGVAYFDMNNTGSYTSGDPVLGNTNISYYNTTYNIYYNVTTNSNGYYKITNMIPHTYQISVVIDNKTYQYTSTQTLQASKNVTNDLRFAPDRLTGWVASTTSVQNITYQVHIYSDNGFDKLISTNNTGYYHIFLAPGIYYVAVDSGIRRSPVYSASFSTWGANVTQNITVTHVFHVTGYVNGTMGIAANALVKLDDVVNNQNTKFVFTNNNGTYNMYIPGGFYTLYTQYVSGGQYYSYMSNVVIDENMSLNVTLQPSYRLSGYITYNNTPITEGIITVFNGMNFIKLYANNTGVYDVYLPSGKYNVGVAGYNSSTSQPYFNYTQVNLYSNLQANIKLQTPITYQGTAYVGSGLNATILGSGLVVMNTTLGPTYATYIAPNNHFLIYTLSPNFSVYVYSYGYAQNEVNFTQKSIIVRVAPSSVPVSGTVHFSNINYTGPLNIEFVNGTSVTQIPVVNDKFTGSILPGKYNITLQAPGLEPYSKLKNITVSGPSFPLTLNINAVMLAKVNITNPLSYTLWFDTSGNLMNIGSTVLLPIGTFTYYSFSQQSAAISQISVQGNENVSLSAVQAYSVTLSVPGYSSSIPVKIVMGSYILTRPVTGSATVYLPAGNYSFSVYYPTNENGVIVLYSGKTTIHISANTDVIVPVSRSLLTGLVKGSLTVGASPIPFGTIELVSQSNYTNITYVSTNSNGYYSVDLPVGYYLAYVSYQKGEYFSYLQNITVKSETLNLNISLSTGYYVSGIATVNGVPNNNPINVTYQNSTFITDPNDGIYNLILPYGQYYFHSSVKAREYNMAVAYFMNHYVTINSSMTVNLPYSRNNVTQVSLSLVSSTPPGVPGNVIEYTVNVTNTGNTPETVSLEAVAPGWSVSFSQNNVFVNPNTTAPVKVSAVVPTTVNFGTNNFYIRAVYSGQVAPLELSMNAGAYYNYSLSVNSKNGSAINNSLNYPVTLRNGGDISQTYQLIIINSWQLKTLGWNASLYYNNTLFNGTVKVAAQSEITLILKLTPSNEFSSNNVRVEFNVITPQGSSMYTFTPIIPQIQGSNTKLTGLNVTSVVPQFDYTQVLLVLMVFFAAISTLWLAVRLRK